MKSISLKILKVTLLLAIGICLFSVVSKVNAEDWRTQTGIIRGKEETQISTRQVEEYPGHYDQLKLVRFNASEIDNPWDYIKKDEYKVLNNVKWSSSDRSIIEVDSKGNIKVKKHGKATVTGKSGEYEACLMFTVKNDYEGLQASIASVCRKEPYLIFGIEGKQTFKKGYEADLGINYKKDFTEQRVSVYKDIQWSSSNPKIVKISSNGHIECVGIGKATITGKYNTEYFEKTAILDVTVTENGQSNGGSSSTPGADGTSLISSIISLIKNIISNIMSIFFTK